MSEYINVFRPTASANQRETSDFTVSTKHIYSFSSSEYIVKKEIINISFCGLHFNFFLLFV